MVAARLEGSGYRSGCAIATMVLELASENEELSTEFETVFGRRRAALTRQFETWAIAPGRAIGLADLVMSGFEGALVLSRAARGTDVSRPRSRQSPRSSTMSHRRERSCTHDRRASRRPWPRGSTVAYVAEAAGPGSVDGRHLLLVGAGPGLGLAVARPFAVGGYRVTLVARSTDGLRDLAGTLADSGARISIIAADASDPDGRAPA
jgi:hypothetical protein